MSKLMELRRKVSELSNVDYDERVWAVKRQIRKERQPEIDALNKQIEALREKRPEKKPRWPDNVPANVMDVCKKYWSGTTEYATFRIHCWNDKLVCTSYPSGGYSTNGGWTPSQACFFFLSLTQLDPYKPKHIGVDLEGRQSAKKLLETLEERSKNL